MGMDENALEMAAARFVVDFGVEHLRDETRTALRLLLKDQLSVQIGVSQLPWAKQIRAYAEENRLPGNATVVAEEEKMDAASAAFVNAGYGHGFEYDDIHRASGGHPGCCVIPTALAIGEDIGANLGQVLVAIVAGYEVYTRIGILAAPDLLKRGWHPHSVLANFGAAAVAAKLWNLDVEKTLHALAIAASHASGITEYSSTGGSIKRVHASIGVKNGIQAASLARHGITGPSRFLTGNKGFFHAFVQKKAGSEAASVFSLDESLQIETPWLKPYCACGATHAYIDAMTGFSGQADNIERIDLRIQPKADSIVGNQNANIYAPNNIEELQYALPVQMALAVLDRGNGYRTHRDFLAGKLDLGPDTDVIRLARKIKITEVPELDEKYLEKFVADVTIVFNDQKEESVFIENSKGTPENQLGNVEIEGKINELTFEVIGEEKASQLFSAIERMDESTRVADLMRFVQR